MNETKNNKLNNYNPDKEKAGIVYKNKKYKVKNNAILALELSRALEDAENVNISELLISLKNIIPELYEELKKDDLSFNEFGAIAGAVIQIAAGQATENIVLNREFFRNSLKGI